MQLECDFSMKKHIRIGQEKEEHWEPQTHLFFFFFFFSFFCYQRLYVNPENTSATCTTSFPE